MPTSGYNKFNQYNWYNQTIGIWYNLTLEPIQLKNICRLQSLKPLEGTRVTNQMIKIRKLCYTTYYINDAVKKITTIMRRL